MVVFVHMLITDTAQLAHKFQAGSISNKNALIDVSLYDLSPNKPLMMPELVHDKPCKNEPQHHQ